ncbi:MAG: helix-turn-helix transcriptional regulator [Deltaproteobacteria bacterium]|nr:helix-turn-helix transcriptional regulator [Deltaproteobacteria bacterium]
MKLELPEKAIKEIKAILAKYHAKYYNPRVVAEVLSRSQRVPDVKLKDLSRFLDIKVKSSDYLKEQRKRMGFTLAKLSALTGIAVSNLSALESGKRSLGVITAKKLAKALKIHYKALI